MSKTFCTLFVVLFTFSILASRDAQAEIPPKAKAFLTIVGYGAGGGALLGAASMAFGTNSRAVAQGASLGLYAGILFGTYVLVSHHQKKYGSYDDRSSPYGESTDIYGDDYRSDEGGGGEASPRGGFFDRYQSIQGQFKKRGGNLPPLYMNLLNYNF